MNDGIAGKKGDEFHDQHGQGQAASELDALRTSQAARPGILIYSRRTQMLHCNRRALELTGQLNQGGLSSLNTAALGPVENLRILIEESLDHRKAANLWELFELKRVIFDAGRKILIRGFGLANQKSHNDSRIVIVLEEGGLRQDGAAPGTVGPVRPHTDAAPSA